MLVNLHGFPYFLLAYFKHVLYLPQLLNVLRTLSIFEVSQIAKTFPFLLFFLLAYTVPCTAKDMLRNFFNK